MASGRDPTVAEISIQCTACFHKEMQTCTAAPELITFRSVAIAWCLIELGSATLRDLLASIRNSVAIAWCQIELGSATLRDLLASIRNS